jgi:hypothetical protein
LKEKSSGSGLEIREYGRRGSVALTKPHPSIRKRSLHYLSTEVGADFADKRRSSDMYSSVAD